MDTIIINNEECRRIKNFERYHISVSGRIYRTETAKKRSWRTEGKVYISENKIHFRVRNNKLRDGLASLTDTEGTLHSVAVAPIVATAFGLISRKFNSRKQAITYKDGNKRNLHYNNLVVVIRAYANSKLTHDDIKQIKKQIKLGVPLNSTARRFGVSEMQISRIKTGENWGNGKRKIPAPEAPFEIKDGKMRKYIATFDSKKVMDGVKKPFTVRRNAKKPTDNAIVGIVMGYKLSLKHTNITRAREIVEKLNQYFFGYETEIQKLYSRAL